MDLETQMRQEIASNPKQLKTSVTASIMLIVGIAALGLYLSNKEPEPTPEPTCEVVNGDGHIFRGQCLPEGFEPEVFPLNRRASWLNTQQYLDLRAKIMVEELIEDAEADGVCLVVTSGYRSYIEQENLLEASEDTSLIASAGGSEHQTGLAVDFGACPMSNGKRDDSVERDELINDFETLPEYKWLERNAWTYGFEQSFTVENIADSGYPVEGWHWKLIIK